MKTIEELLRNLARPEVLEFALASDRLPCVKVGGSFQPVDGAAPTTDAILQMLVGVGGSRYVESLSTKPTQWTTRIDGLGVVTISAIMRNDVVQARFTLTKREIPQVQARPQPPGVGKDTVTVTPTARQEIPTAKRDPRREQTEPPKPPRHSDEDDEPTLMNQPPGPGPAPARAKMDVPLEIELDDTARPAPAPQQVGPPRPPAPTPLEDDDTTAEIGVPSAPSAPKPVVVVQNPGAAPVAPPPPPPPGAPPPPSAQGRVSTGTQPLSGAVPSTAKGPPPSGAVASEQKEPLRAHDTQRMQVVSSADKKPKPGEVASPPRSEPKVQGAPPASAPSLAAAPALASAPSPPAPPVAASATSFVAKPPPEDKREEPSIPSISISIAETALIGSVSGAQPAAGMGLDELLGLARAAGASDLHLVAGRPALLRVCGELTPRTTALDPAVVEGIARDIVPKRVAPQLEMEGACDFALDHGTHGRFRANVSRQRTGFKVCLRLVPREIPTLAALGIPETVAQATHHHQGLILLTGPAGHGKTSTMAALVDIINRESAHHIITVEDPVEFVHPRKKAMLSQREVGTHTRSFASALKAALREDPDVIAVGELRDTETVRMALAASETGHLVLGTMSTPSAAKTIDRVIDLFPPAEQQQVRMTLAGALRLIVSQRLVLSADKTRLVAAAEVLPGSISLYTLIRDNKTYQIPSLQQRGRAQGIVRLDDSLADLVRAGRTTTEAARLFAESPDDFEALLGQRPQAAGAAVPLAQPAPGVLPKKRAPEEQAMDLGGLLSKAGSLFGGKKG